MIRSARQLCRFVCFIAVLLLINTDRAAGQVLDAVDIHLNLREKVADSLVALSNTEFVISEIGTVQTDPSGVFSFTYPVRNQVDPVISITLLNDDRKMLKPLDGSIQIDPDREAMYIDFLVVNMDNENEEFKQRIQDLEGRMQKLKAKNQLTERQLNVLNNTLLDTIVFYEANKQQLEAQIREYENLTDEQQSEISALQQQVSDLESQVDQLTFELEEALEERFLRQNQFFKDISGSLLNYLRKTKDLRDHLPRIKSYFNSPGGYQNFDQDIRAYNDIWINFDSNHLSYLRGVENYWEDDRVSKKLEEVFEFLSKSIHQNQVLTVINDINAELHKQKPGRAQKIANLAYEDMTINVLALEQDINRVLNQLRRNI